MRRLIPVIQLDLLNRVIKTVRFHERTYVGDPFNIVRIYNDLEVDEICILGIDTRRQRADINTDFLSRLAGECFMPLSYGGGINSEEDCVQLNRIGIEKFVMGQSSLNYNLIQSIAKHLGNQAVVACVDVKKHNDDFLLFEPTLGRINGSIKLIDHLVRLQDSGVGEIIVQSVNLDGTRSGYDLDLIHYVSSVCKVPLIALGGGGEYLHAKKAFESGADGVASGSMFSFYGKLRAVLLNYPNLNLRSELG